MKHDDLIQRFLDGHASSDDAAELSQLVSEDEAARRRYLDLAELHAALAADETLRGPRAEAVPFAPRLRWDAWAWKIAAVLLIAAVGVWMLSSGHKAAPPIATLISTVNARWSDPATELSLNAGEAPSGLLRLVEGTAQFVTAKGASVVLEAPAVMRFDGPTAIFVESGKVVCRCPTPTPTALHHPARGCEERATPGTIHGRIINPERVESMREGGRIQPLQGGCSCCRQSRGSRACVAPTLGWRMQRRWRWRMRGGCNAGDYIQVAAP